MALPNYPPHKRREVAERLGIEEQYLYQIIRGLRAPSPTLARQLHELDYGFALQELRPDDWEILWPELKIPLQKTRAKKL